MTYNIVPTVATGDVWTASNENTYVRDNFAGSDLALVMAKGDLFFGAGLHSGARLQAYNDYSLLISLASQVTGMSYSEYGPACIIQRSTALSIAHDSLTTVTAFDTEILDNLNMHVAGANTIVIPAGLAGTYLIGCYGVYAAGGAVNLMHQIRVKTDDAYDDVTQSSSQDANSNDIQLVCTFLADLADGKSISMDTVQKSGSAKNIDNATLWAIRLR